MMRFQSVIRSPKRLLGMLSHSPKRAFSYPLHLDEGYSPFFIVGSGRSGNTLLRRILMAHDDVYIPPETYVLGRCVRDFKKHSTLGWSLLCHLMLSKFAFSKDFETFPVRSLRPCLLGLDKAPKEQRSLAFILHELYSFLGQHAKPSFIKWGDKTPLNTFSLKEIDKVFPSSRYLHVVRDGCDVVYSYLNMGRYSNIDDAADRWLQSTALCQEFGKTRKHKFMQISYEDLVTRPNVNIEMICDFLGLTFHHDIIDTIPTDCLGDVNLGNHHANVLQAISTASIGKGRSNLTIEQRQMLHKKITPRLLALGYAPVL